MANQLSNVVRRKFIEYFTHKRAHKFVRSSSVRPDRDSGLTFVSAGVNQFKRLITEDSQDYFLKRACNYQKCIRVGGKMCDLDKIGSNFRHHTFFEMLGNWSFNDYGKPEACEWALDFLVNHLELDEKKISITYFKDENFEDTETRDIWLRLGISVDRVIANTIGDNFWTTGSDGPCGVSTEIFYPVGGELLEIWNLVFVDRQKLSSSGKIVPLRSKFVDTGMGLERILTVLNGVESNYDTDLFQGMFRAIEAKSNVAPYGGSLSDELDISYRILADHGRMITIALADGVEPGRRAAEFIVRSIIKKSLLIARDVFHQETPKYLLFDLMDETVESLSQAYPELPGSVKKSRATVANEARRFFKHLKNKALDEKDSTLSIGGD